MYVCMWGGSEKTAIPSLNNRAQTRVLPMLIRGGEGADDDGHESNKGGSGGSDDGEDQDVRGCRTFHMVPNTAEDF